MALTLFIFNLSFILPGLNKCALSAVRGGIMGICEEKREKKGINVFAR